VTARIRLDVARACGLQAAVQVRAGSPVSNYLHLPVATGWDLLFSPSC
jgi:hypothetical protein